MVAVPGTSLRAALRSVVVGWLLLWFFVSLGSGWMNQILSGRWSGRGSKALLVFSCVGEALPMTDSIDETLLVFNVFSRLGG